MSGSNAPIEDAPILGPKDIVSTLLENENIGLAIAELGGSLDEILSVPGESGTEEEGEERQVILESIHSKILDKISGADSVISQITQTGSFEELQKFIINEKDKEYILAAFENAGLDTEVIRKYFEDIKAVLDNAITDSLSEDSKIRPIFNQIKKARALPESFIAELGNELINLNFEEAKYVASQIELSKLIEQAKQRILSKIKYTLGTNVSSEVNGQRNFTIYSTRHLHDLLEDLNLDNEELAIALESLEQLVNEAKLKAINVIKEKLKQDVAAEGERRRSFGLLNPSQLDHLLENLDLNGEMKETAKTDLKKVFDEAITDVFETIQEEIVVKLSTGKVDFETYNEAALKEIVEGLNLGYSKNTINSLVGTFQEAIQEAKTKALESIADRLSDKIGILIAGFGKYNLDSLEASLSNLNLDSKALKKATEELHKIVTDTIITKVLNPLRKELLATNTQLEENEKESIEANLKGKGVGEDQIRKFIGDLEGSVKESKLDGILHEILRINSFGTFSEERKLMTIKINLEAAGIIDKDGGIAAGLIEKYWRVKKEEIASTIQNQIEALSSARTLYDLVNFHSERVYKEKFEAKGTIGISQIIAGTRDRFKEKYDELSKKLLQEYRRSTDITLSEYLEKKLLGSTLPRGYTVDDMKKIIADISRIELRT